MEKVKVADLDFGYELYRDEYNQVFIKTPGENSFKLVPPVEGKSVYIGTKGVKSVEEAEKLVESGVAKKYTTFDLYKLAIPDEEEFCLVFYKMPKEVKEIVDSFNKEKGLIEKHFGIEERSPLIEKEMKNATLLENWDIPILPNPLVEVYILKNGNYAVEFVRSYIDSFSVYTWIFNKKPTKEDFIELLLLEEAIVRKRYEYIQKKYSK